MISSAGAPGGVHHAHVRQSFQDSLESIAAGLLRGGDQQKQAALFLIQLLREGGAYIATEACRCAPLVNSIKLLMASDDLQQQEDASLLLLELSIFPSAAAELYASKIHLVAATIRYAK